MNKIINEFFKCYLNWVLAGHPDTKMFVNRLGLCAMLTRFTRRLEMPAYERSRLQDELALMFMNDDMHMDFPFNAGNMDAWNHEMYSGIGHQPNTNRVMWVKSKVTDYEPEKEMNEFLGWLSDYPNTWSKRHEISGLWRERFHGRNMDGISFK